MEKLLNLWPYNDLSFEENVEFLNKNKANIEEIISTSNFKQISYLSYRPVLYETMLDLIMNESTYLKDIKEKTKERVLIETMGKFPFDFWEYCHEKIPDEMKLIMQDKYVLSGNVLGKNCTFNGAQAVIALNQIFSKLIQDYNDILSIPIKKILKAFVLSMKFLNMHWNHQI